MKEKEYELGLVSVSFRQSSPKEILQAVRAAGLSCIEWGSDVHAPCHDTERLHEIASLQKEYGVLCSSYGTYFRLGKTPISELEDYIRAAKTLGTDTLRLWCGEKTGTDMTESEQRELLAVCRSAARLAQEYGVTLCMECHRKTFTENPDDAVWLMQSVASLRFRMYWQPFQWQSTDENLENAKRIAPFAEHIHVFNWKKDKKLPLAEGITEWRKYLSVLPAPRTLLLEFMPCGTVAELSAEADALRSIIGENE